MVIGLVTPACAQQPAVQWQAVNQLITNMQNQLNQLQSQITGSLPPSGGSGGQFLIEGAHSPGWFTLSGDLVCSTSSYGNCTVATVLGGKAPVITTGTNTAGGTTGVDTLDNFNIAKVRNVLDFGATASTTTANATTVAANAVASFSAIGDFTIGQSVRIAHAGVAGNAVTPTACSATPQSYNNNPNPTSDITHANCQTDAVSASNPAHNAACVTTHRYQVVGVAVDGSWSAPTAVFDDGGVGPTTLSSNNSVLVSCTGKTPDIAYLVYLCTGGGCTPVLGAVVPQVGAAGATTQTYRDMGHHFGTDETFGTTLQAGSEPADLYTKVDGISGTNVTLHVAPQQNGTFVVRHDDSVGINAAITSICSHTNTGGSTQSGAVYFPGQHSYQLAQSISTYGCLGILLEGAAPNGDGGRSSDLAWHGVIGGTMISMNKTADSQVKNMAHGGTNGTTAGVFLNIDNYTTGGGGDGTTTQNDGTDGVEVGNTAIGIQACNATSSNCQNMHFADTQVSNPNASGAVNGGLWAYQFGPDLNAYNMAITGKGLLEGYDVGIMIRSVGSLSIYNQDYELNRIANWLEGKSGGSSDGNILFENITSEGHQYWIYDNASSNQSTVITRGSRIADSAGPDGFIINSARIMEFDSDFMCGFSGTYTLACAVGTSGPVFSWDTQWSDATPFMVGSGAQSDKLVSYAEYNDHVNVAGGGGGTLVAYKLHQPTTQACTDNGVVTTNQNMNFAQNSCQKYSSLTTGLTFTFKTSTMVVDQVVTLEFYSTGAPGAAPLLAVDSGAFRWVGGAAPTLSNTANYTDTLKMKWDGAFLIDEGKAIGAH